MKIADVEVINFRTTTIDHRSRWGFLVLGDEVETTESITRISTDEGVEGYMIERGYKAYKLPGHPQIAVVDKQAGY
jgi:hypothetical protein